MVKISVYWIIQWCMPFIFILFIDGFVISCLADNNRNGSDPNFITPLPPLDHYINRLGSFTNEIYIKANAL
jgi:hypothetical protein